LAFDQKQPMSSRTHEDGDATKLPNDATMDALSAVPCVAVPI